MRFEEHNQGLNALDPAAVSTGYGALVSAALGLALSDNPQYRGLVNCLPVLVWERLQFTVLFVSKDAGAYTS